MNHVNDTILLSFGVSNDEYIKVVIFAGFFSISEFCGNDEDKAGSHDQKQSMFEMDERGLKIRSLQHFMFWSVAWLSFKQNRQCPAKVSNQSALSSLRRTYAIPIKEK